MPSPPSPADDPLDRLTRAREELKSIDDDEPDTGVTNIPDDAPPRVKGLLAALFSLPPAGRVVALVVLGLAAIGAATLLVLRGVKLF